MRAPRSTRSDTVFPGDRFPHDATSSSATGSVSETCSVSMHLWRRARPVSVVRMPTASSSSERIIAWSAPSSSLAGPPDSFRHRSHRQERFPASMIRWRRKIPQVYEPAAEVSDHGDAGAAHRHRRGRSDERSRRGPASPVDRRRHAKETPPRRGESRITSRRQRATRLRHDHAPVRHPPPSFP
jgi:hypothetical protein